jgi:hypothetical protein
MSFTLKELGLTDWEIGKVMESQVGTTKRQQKPTFKHFPYEGCYRISHNGNEGIIVKHWLKNGQGYYSWRIWNDTTTLGMGTTSKLAEAKQRIREVL